MACRISSDFEGRSKNILSKYRRRDRGEIDSLEIPRLVHTLRLIGSIVPSPERICDVATFGSIDPAIQQLFAIENITTTGFPEIDGENEIAFCDDKGAVSHRFVHDRFDIEAGFPYADGSFDLVLFTEVLEHITRDPMHTLAEINRITRHEGWLVLSTPNCVSARAVLSALRGNHPYLWSQYSHHCHRDRHNREYTPAEVSMLLAAAGYEIHDLHCHSVYDTAVALHRRWAKRFLAWCLGLLRFLLAGRSKAGWGGDVIFVVARKISPITNRYPDFLYY